MSNYAKIIDKVDGRVSGDFDFIGKWVELLDKFTDANRELKEAAGLFALSSLVGHKAIIPCPSSSRPFSEVEEGTGTKMGKRLNLWFLIIGRSRWSRKTTVANLTRDFLSATLGHNYLLTTVSTPEALIDELAENTTSFGCHKAWIIDEFAIILEARRKDYMAEFEGILQKLYDGDTFSRRTRSRGRVTVKDPYFTVFACTTPYSIEKRLLDESMFVHGFLNRFLIIWDEGTRNPIPIGEHLKQSITDYRDIVEELIRSGRLYTSTSSVITLGVSSEVLKLLSEIEARAEERGKDDEIINLYLGNMTDFLLKLSGLYRLSRLKPSDLSGRIVVVEEEDFKRARNFMKHVLRSVEKLRFEMKLQTSVRPRSGDIKSMVDTVSFIVTKHGERTSDGCYVITRERLYRLWNGITHRGREDLDKVLDEMRELGLLLDESELSTSTRGRKRRVYTFKFT